MASPVSLLRTCSPEGEEGELCGGCYFMGLSQRSDIIPGLRRGLCLPWSLVLLPSLIRLCRSKFPPCSPGPLSCHMPVLSAVQG